MRSILVLYSLTVVAACVELPVLSMVPAEIEVRLDRSDNYHVLVVEGEFVIEVNVSFCGSHPGVRVLQSQGVHVLYPKKLFVERSESSCGAHSDPFYQPGEGETVDRNVSMLVRLLVSTGSTVSVRLESFEPIGDEQSLGAALLSPSISSASAAFPVRGLDSALSLEVYPETGEVEVFVTFCADYLGEAVKRPAPVRAPGGLAHKMQPEEIAALIEKQSCPSEDLLYHDFERNPPKLIVRVRGAGNVLVAVTESEASHPSRSFRSLPSSSLHLPLSLSNGTEESITLKENEYRIEFSVSGAPISLSLHSSCGDCLPLGDYAEGEQTVDVREEIGNLTCNATFSLHFSSLGQSTVLFSAEMVEEGGVSKLTLTLVLLGVSILVAAAAVFLPMIKSQEKKLVYDVQKEEEAMKNSVNIPMQDMSRTWM